MIALAGLPDFSQPLGDGAAPAFQAFGGAGVVVPPTGVVLASDAAGKPRFLLVLERSADLFDASGQSAVLDVELTPHYPLDEALTQARLTQASASASAAPIDLGFVRLVPAGDATGLGPAAREAVPLGWSAADGARWTLRLDAASGALIKGALTGGALLLGARLEFTILGVAERAAAKVTFDPAALLAGLIKGGDGAVAAADLLAYLTQPADGLHIQISGGVDQRRAPQILADRLFAAYGTLAPAAAADGPLTIAFAKPPAGAVTWDLSQPTAVPRGFVVQLDLLAALRSAKASDCVRELDIPPLDLGFRQVTVTANLPPHRSGVPAIGVRLDMPAAPPPRPNAISQTLTLQPPDDGGVIKLRLGPGEALSYHLTCFAVIAAGSDVRQWESPPQSLSDTWLSLQATDFPLTFAHLTAAPRLVAIASLDGVLTYTLGGTLVRQPIHLDAAAPDIAVAIPTQAQDAVVTLSATALAGGASLPLTPLPAGRCLLDLPLFAAYGPHRVSIACDFSEGEEPVTVQLVGEDGGNPASITLTSAMPASEWGYVAASPFKAGYRYKIGGDDWSAPQPFDAPLRLKAAAAPVLAPQVIEGVHVYGAADRPGSVFYVPEAPTAQEDGAGHPSVSVIRTPERVMVQVGARFTLTDAARDQVVQKLAWPKPPDLQPAPIQVRKAALMLTEPDGSERELATSTSSLYPPFNAVFSASLDAVEGARAISAVQGGQGLLFVDYTISLPPAAAAAYAGAPDTLVCRADLADWIAPGEAPHVTVIG
jgi:hypothetical protein